MSVPNRSASIQPTAPQKPPRVAKKLPPMLQQYRDYKEQYPDALLFIQVGDFYELFFEDAVTVAGQLNLTLTSRDKNSPEPIPMCGVPVAVVDGYVERLVDLGFSAAIVSQCSLPQPGKGMVERKLDRIVTPGVRVTGGVESGGYSGGVATLVVDQEERFGLVFGEVESGKLSVRDSVSFDHVLHELLRIAPAELILPHSIGERTFDRRKSWIRVLTERLRNTTVKYRSEEYLRRCATSSRSMGDVQGYAVISPIAKKAVLLFVNYVDETTVDAQVSLRKIETGADEGLVEIDATSRRNLELLVNDRDRSEEGSLYHYMNRCLTSGGKRLLREWIVSPLAHRKEIEIRQNAVTELFRSPSAREKLRDHLRIMTDLQRLATRIELGIISPRELIALRDAARCLPELYLELNREELEPLRLTLFSAGSPVRFPDELNFLGDLLGRALVDSPPVQLAEGGVFCSDYDPELAKWSEIRTSGGKWMAALEQAEREATGIPSLKVRFNNVLGYFLEVTKANLSRVPDHYQQRQTMTNVSRFTTVELKEREEQILSAKSRQIERERVLFGELLEQLKSSLTPLREVYSVLSQLDVLQCLAQLAEDEDLIAPKLTDENILFISEGRHPVLSSFMAGNFVPNSLDMEPSSKQFLVITGPNMGGKSTYLRQAALITVMAQIGGYVPAKEATIGLVDRIFARLGANDDMLEGESTFMVEMREASMILSAATDRSLVLIDEIGRGTATADGLALAHSIVEWLVNRVGCRTLFATHFHELTALEQSFAPIRNLSVGSVDRGGQVIFTHQICGGAASRSYGLEVARLAGLPEQLLERAQELLEEHRNGIENHRSSQQLDIFGGTPVAAPRVEVREPEDYQRLKVLREKLEGVDPNSTTPFQALEFLAQLCEES